MTLLDATLSAITPVSDAARQTARAHLEQLFMPHWALGKIMDLGVELAGITGSQTPAVGRKCCVVMAADHGVVEEAVSPCPQELTYKVVRNFLLGKSSINILCKTVGADVHVVDMGMVEDTEHLAREFPLIRQPVAPGTKNLAREWAMSREEAILSVETGIRIATRLGEFTDVFATGEMGIGNTTPSAALIAVLAGIPADAATGTGSGLDETQRRAKAAVIERAISKHNPDPADGIDTLAKIGGFEIGGIAGVMLGCAAMKKPVLLDGIISTAAALVAQALSPASAGYMLATHQSAEQGHTAALHKLGKKSLFDLDFRLGEGTGAVMAMPILDSAVGILTEMLTFEEAEAIKF